MLFSIKPKISDSRLLFFEVQLRRISTYAAVDFKKSLSKGKPKLNID